jgi:hypothetical protein
MLDVRNPLIMVALVGLGCGSPPKPAAPVAPPKIKLAVLMAESDKFPKAAQAATDSLAKVKLPGIDETQLATVSLEVIQLSIECVEPTPACYEEVGRSLTANKLLFAQIAAGEKRKQVKVTITLFDVDSKAPAGSSEKVFKNEKEAAAGIADLVTEATR